MEFIFADDMSQVIAAALEPAVSSEQLAEVPIASVPAANQHAAA